MHPFAIFPQLLTYGLVSPLLLRLAVGFFILFLGWEHYKKPTKWCVVVYAISGLLLILGWYTQIAVIIGIVVIKTDYWMNKKSHQFSAQEKALYAMSVVVLLSLLATGPGFLAFDLPL